MFIPFHRPIPGRPNYQAQVKNDRRKIVIGASADLLVSVLDGQVPPEYAGRKRLARAIDLSNTEDGGICRVQVEGGGSVEVTFHGESETFSSGSSVNVACVLRKLGCSHEIAVVAPLGRDETGDNLRTEMVAKNIQPVELRGEATALTLSLRDPTARVGSTVFCQKFTYEVPTDAWLDDRLGAGQFDIVALTSTKVRDLEIAAMLAKRARLLAFMPHKELLQDIRKRDCLLALTRRANFVQVNEHEAAAFMGRAFASQDIKVLWGRLGRPGALVVTLAEQGAVYQDQDSMITMPSEPIHRAVDPCGAGDTHFASVVYAMYCLGIPAGGAMELAAWVAARSVTDIGPYKGVPSEEGLRARFGADWLNDWTC